MYTLHCLNNALAGLIYEPFTFPLYRPQLQSFKPEGSTVAIAASDSGRPIGLALAEIQPDAESAEVLSIFVKPTHRRQGIGTAIFTRLEQELISRGCTNVKLSYTTGQPTTLAVERLLQKCNWTSPKPQSLMCKSTAEKLAAAPWLYLYSLPPEFSIFPWFDLTPAQRRRIQQQQDQQQWYPEYLTPFSHESKLEPLNSLCLRYQGEVVGWIITHRITPNTIRYTSLFVRQDLQKLGRAVPMLAEAIKRQVNSEIFYNTCAVSLDNQSMVNFVKRRLAPYLTSLEESRYSFKSLIELSGTHSVSMSLALVG